ncbi:hypothetical protein DFJ73DRAFT_890042 [Zopfochytrium polystomum]|nr:hypothetical protein DFJ73DRAFT_890042 [Zopfochytrium polystomum]
MVAASADDEDESFDSQDCSGDDNDHEDHHSDNAAVNRPTTTTAMPPTTFGGVRKSPGRGLRSPTRKTGGGSTRMRLGSNTLRESNADSLLTTLSTAESSGPETVAEVSPTDPTSVRSAPPSTSLMADILASTPFKTVNRYRRSFQNMFQAPMKDGLLSWSLPSPSVPLMDADEELKKIGIAPGSPIGSGQDGEGDANKANADECKESTADDATKTLAIAPKWLDSSLSAFDRLWDSGIDFTARAILTVSFGMARHPARWLLQTASLFQTPLMMVSKAKVEE